MTLQECKEQIAQQYEAHLKEQIDGHPGLHHGGELPWSEEDVNDRVTKLYASEKVKEALKLAAHHAGVVFIDGVTKEETIHGQIMSGANIIRPYRDGILSLESELINQINKEI